MIFKFIGGFVIGWLIAVGVFAVARWLLTRNNKSEKKEEK